MLDTNFVLNEWVPALRSGNYEQGEGALFIGVSPERIDRYCCLGVACTLIPEITIEQPYDSLIAMIRDDDGKAIGSSGSALPLVVGDRLGLDWGGGLVLPPSFVEEGSGELLDYFVLAEPFNKNTPTADEKGDNYVVSLAQLNDSCDWTFVEIADLLEAVAIEWSKNESTAN